MSSEEKKPVVDPPTKSSMEILSELFSTFDAEPPVIVKNEVDEESTKKHKKSKKKHKHKDKKHRKKPKKRKHSPSRSSDSSAVDLTDLLIKKEKQSDPVNLNGACLKEKIGSIKAERDVTEMNSKNSESKLHDASDSKKKRIVIKDLKFSSIFDATILAIKEQEKLKESTEDGELSQSDVNSGDEKLDGDVQKRRMKKEKHKKKQKHSKHDAEKLRKRKRSNRSPSRERSRKRSRSLSADSTKSEKFRDKSCVHHHHKDRHKRRSSDRDSKDESVTTDSYSKRNMREKDEFRRRSRECHEHRRSKERGDYDHEDKKHKYNSFYRTDIDKEEKWFVKERYRGHSDRNRERERRFRETSEDGATHIDKKKLLEIARKNAIQMMKSGSLPGALTLGPQAQEKVIAAIKSGGKTVEELTDFCKTLSKKEELGELSSVSEDNMSDSDGEKPFHHPFQIKERPVSITMNIKNSVPLPIKNSQERASELRIQFPVSSGQQHRKTENEWIPVLPKKTEAAVIKPTPTTNYVTTSLQTELPPQPPVVSSVPLPSPVPSVTVPAHSVPQVFLPTANTEQNIDIATIVSQRLSAMRKLQENPDDVKALNVMYKAQKEMNSWAESKQQIGQFTGSTGAQILSLAELSSGYQAWARKDQFQTAAPVSGGMGMHLLQKMGWKPGEGLGKEKTGALEPLLLEVKLDKKGIVAKEEQKKKQAKLQKATPKTLQGKHPVSLLGEYASKHKLGAPQYDLCFECGPDHKKNFLFRVILNGIEYKPQVASPNKKEAKANAALICLQQLGILQQS